MELFDPQSSREFVAERQVTSRTLISAWSLALLALVALMAVPAPSWDSRVGYGKPATQKEARQTTVEHEC